MLAIYKKELKSYFHSFVGPLFIGVTLFLFGIYFTAYDLFMGYPYIGYALSAVIFLFFFSVPLLSMRILAEERKQKTDQFLLTAPIRVSDIVLGKFYALSTLLFIPVAIIGIYPLVLSAFGEISLTDSYFSIVKVNSGRSITKAEVTLANPYAEVTLANFTSLAYFML